MTKKKRDLMPARVKRAKATLEKISHDFVRGRDSDEHNKHASTFGGKCVDCGIYDEGQYFQAGHFEASGSCGALLRYHPHNMHGQRAGCNLKYRQEQVKINYTMVMIAKYGKDYVDLLRSLKNKSIKADIIFYETLINLYKQGNEEEIVDFLNGHA
jgi:hypothetical protein